MSTKQQTLWSWVNSSMWSWLILCSHLWSFQTFTDCVHIENDKKVHGLRSNFDENGIIWKRNSIWKTFLRIQVKTANFYSFSQCEVFATIFGKVKTAFCIIWQFWHYTCNSVRKHSYIIMRAGYATYILCLIIL